MNRGYWLKVLVGCALLFLLAITPPSTAAGLDHSSHRLENHRSLSSVVVNPSGIKNTGMYAISLQSTIPVNGTIGTDTTWTAGNVYVINNDLTVANGVTLTLEPGVVVKFAALRALRVNGSLMAVGTAAQPIVFTSYQDDSVGGDTNGDGSASIPAPGDWNQIAFAAGSQGQISHAIIRYGGRAYLGGGTLSTDMLSSVSSNPLVLDTVRVEQSAGNGISATGANLTVRNSQIVSNRYSGIGVTGGTITVRDSQIISNTYTGLDYRGLAGATSLVVINNRISGNYRISGNGHGLTLSLNGVLPPQITVQGNTITDTTLNGVDVSGTLSQNLTWPVTNDPLVINNDLTVAQGTTLTLEPGVVVKFAGLRSLRVNGSLLAVGTAAQPIVFTSYQDDSAGGDTNGDGSASSPAPGDWNQIAFAAGSQGRISYASIRYGGLTTLAAQSLRTDMLVSVSSNPLVLDTVQVEQSAGNGISATGANLTVRNSQILNNVYAGIYVSRATSLEVVNNHISGNGQDLTLSLSSPLPPRLTVQGNTRSGSTLNGVLVSGTLSQNLTWPSTNNPLVINNDLTVASGATLTLEPGVVVKFAMWCSLRVNGSLLAVGTAAQPIVFTSYQDDSAGGDTNGDGSASSPVPGDWTKIAFAAGSQGRISYASIRYGGLTTLAAQWLRTDMLTSVSSNPLVLDTVRVEQSAGNGIGATGANLTVRNSQIVSNTVGVQANNTRLTIEDSLIAGNHQGVVASGESEVRIARSSLAGNTQYGVNNTNAKTLVLATENWWGSALGPFHATLNPTSKGDQVSDKVAYTPWLRVPLANAAQRSPIPVTVGSVYRREIAGLSINDFVYNATQDENLEVEVRLNGSTTDSLLLLGSFGSLPLPAPGSADAWTDQAHGGAYHLLIPALHAGNYYLSVVNQNLAETLTYELRVFTTTNRLVEVWPTVVPPAPAVLGTSGIFRTSQQAIKLCRAGNAAVATGTLDPLSFTQGRIMLDLSSVAPGTYDLCITWPDGSQQTFANGVEVRPGAGRLVTRIETPPATRVGREYVAWLYYANTGNAPIPSPTFIVSARGAGVRIYPNGAYTDTVRLMGLAPNVPFDRLLPGTEQRVPIYFQVTGGPVLNLSVVETSNSQPFPWSEIESRFRPNPAPSDWAQHWASATTSQGSTWGNVIQGMNDLAGMLTVLPTPPSFDDLLTMRLTVAISETVIAAQQIPNESVRGDATLQGLCNDFNPSTDVQLLITDPKTNKLVNLDPATLDLTKPTFFITHGNNDYADNPSYDVLENKIRWKMEDVLKKGKVNIIRVNWKGGAAGGNPWIKTTFCGDSRGLSVIQQSGEEAASKLGLRQIIDPETLEPDPIIESRRQAFCQNLILIGHSFGNAVNYEIAQDICPDIKPRALLLDPASSWSGTSIDSYGKAVDSGNSYSMNSGSPWDEWWWTGIPSAYVHSGSINPFTAHNYTRDVWFPHAIDSCMDPSKPELAGGFVTDTGQPFPGFGSKPRTGTGTDYPVPVVRSSDPNEKQAWVSRVKAGDVVRYTIYFENQSSATAPAQEVFVEDMLDPRLDWSSVRFIDAGFGDYTVPLQSTSLNQRVENTTIIADYRPQITNTWKVNIQASLYPTNGQILWTFRTLTAKTDLPPDDPLAGFLPPNDTSGRGEGHVTFEVRIRQGTPYGTSIPNTATIIFDTNPSIVTPSAVVTVAPPYEVYLPLTRR